MTWHLNALCAFDLETDSPEPEDARIVTACVAIIDGSGRAQPDIATWVLKPTRPIPDAAAEIHGYTTERAQAEGMDPAAGVKAITTALGEASQAGLPIVAFNAAYDLTVTDREMRRHRIGSIDPDGLHVIDPFVLDKHIDRYRKGKRTLTACCEHYRVRIDGAHDASHDALAATRVAWMIAHRNPALARLPLAELHELQMAAKREQDVSFANYLRNQAQRARDVDEQIELHARADACRGHWPLIPHQPNTQEAIA